MVEPLVDFDWVPILGQACLKLRHNFDWTIPEEQSFCVWQQQGRVPNLPKMSFCRWVKWGYGLPRFVLAFG